MINNSIASLTLWKRAANRIIDHSLIVFKAMRSLWARQIASKIIIVAEEKDGFFEDHHHMSKNKKPHRQITLGFVNGAPWRVISFNLPKKGLLLPKKN